MPSKNLSVVFGSESSSVLEVYFIGSPLHQCELSTARIICGNLAPENISVGLSVHFACISSRILTGDFKFSFKGIFNYHLLT